MSKPTKFHVQPAMVWNLFSLLLLVLIAVFFLRGVGAVELAESDNGMAIAQESVVRAAVTCYALEGAYPESYEYLQEHYPLAIDAKKYAVHYEIFAANIMPEITVLKVGTYEK